MQNSDRSKVQSSDRSKAQSSDRSKAQNSDRSKALDGKGRFPVSGAAPFSNLKKKIVYC